MEILYSVLAGLLGVVLVLFLLAWAIRVPPVLKAWRRGRTIRALVSTSKPSGTSASADLPVILVPGILGTTLVDPAHQNFTVWGNYQGGFFFKDKYEDLDLPIMDGVSNRLQAGEVLWDFVVVPRLLRLPMYSEVAHNLAAIGYRTSTLANPTCRRGLYGLSYDFRPGIVDGARALEQAVQTLQNRLGVERVHVIGHSWGSCIIRYYLRYGGADVLNGEPARPGANSLATFFAVGAPYGSLRALLELNEGFTPGPLLRKVAPHHVSAGIAAYQLLNLDCTAVNERGEPLPFDLCDPDTWRRIGLGPWRPGTTEQLWRRAMKANADLTRDRFLVQLHAFLSGNLQRARALSALLQQAISIDKTVRTVTYAAGDEATMSTLVLVNNGPATEVLLSVEAVTRRVPELLPRVTVPGDGYIGIAQVKQHSAHQIETSDCREVPAESYLLLLKKCNHRHLLRDNAVLTNLMLNLCRH